MLILVNGFDENLKTIVRLLASKFQGQRLNAIFISARIEAHIRRSFDIEDEVERLNVFDNICTLRSSNSKAWFKDISKNKKWLKSEMLIVISEFGEKQFLLLFMLFLSGALNFGSKFILIGENESDVRIAGVFGILGDLFGKVFNRKVFNSFITRLSMQLKTKAVWGYPDNMVIEPTNLCNLQCSICPSGLDALKRERGLMKKENFYKLMDEVGPYLRHINFFFMGEPFLNKDALTMVKYAKKRGVSEIEINSNANLEGLDAKAIVESGLDKLVVALDGLSQESYSAYRQGGDIQKVKKFLKDMVDERTRQKSLKPKIILQFIMMAQNIGQKQAVLDFADSVGVDYVRMKYLNVKLADVAYQRAESFIEKDDYERFMEIDPQTKTLKFKKSNIMNFCPYLWNSSAVLFNGDVVACCRDINADAKFGNCFEKGFKAVWNNRKYMKFRKNFLKGEITSVFCLQCPICSKPDE